MTPTPGFRDPEEMEEQDDLDYSIRLQAAIREGDGANTMESGGDELEGAGSDEGAGWDEGTTNVDGTDNSQHQFNPRLKEVASSYDFVTALANASLDSEVEPLSEQVLKNLRGVKNSILAMTDADELFSIELFLAMGNASEATYNASRIAIMKRHPESKILSHYQVKRVLADTTNVEPIVRDACTNSCMAFTGRFTKLDKCPFCSSPRYKPRTSTPYRQFHTFPIGPQIKALWRSPTLAKYMQYRTEHTQRIVREVPTPEMDGRRSSLYTDFFDSDAYLEAVRTGAIVDDDTVLMLSLDGAQLYRNKLSECWIYIWIVMDLPPDRRYKKCHIIPGGISVASRFLFVNDYYRWHHSWAEKAQEPR